MLRNPQVTSVTITASSVHQLRELVRATDLLLSAEETGALANVSMTHAPRTELHHV